MAQTLATADRRASTVASLGTVLKEHYLEPIQKSFNSATVLLSRLKRKSVTRVGGRSYVYPLWAGRNEASGPRADNVPLPYATTTASDGTPGNAQYNRAVLYPTGIYTRFQVTGFALSADRGDDSAVAVLDMEMRAARDAAAENINIQLFGNGSGYLVQLNAAPSGLVYTIDGTTATAAVNRDTNWLHPGMYVTAAASDGTSPVTRKVTAVTGGTSTGSAWGTVTLDATTGVTSSGTASTSDRLYFVGDNNSDTTYARNNALYGLHAIVNNANPDAGNGATLTSQICYGDIDRRAAAGGQFWQGNVIDSGGADLAGSGGSPVTAIDYLYRAMHTSDIVGGGKTSIYITSYQQWRKIGSALESLRRFPGYTKLDGGFNAIMLDGVPIVYEKHCQPDRVYALDESSFELLVESDLDFMADDGAILSRVGSGASARHAYEGVLYWIGQLGCNAPNKNTVITNLAF